jgi:hypothetical protein
MTSPPSLLAFVAVIKMIDIYQLSSLPPPSKTKLSSASKASLGTGSGYLAAISLSMTQSASLALKSIKSLKMPQEMRDVDKLERLLKVRRRQKAKSAIFYPCASLWSI